MQIFYKMPKAKNQKVPEDGSNKESFWYNYGANIVGFIFLAIAFGLSAFIKPIEEYLKYPMFLALIIIYLYWFLNFAPSRLLFLGLDEAAHYLMIGRQKDTFFGKLLNTTYLDIHEIESVNEGFIRFKTGKKHKISEIDSTMATEMNKEIQSLITASGGKAPEQRVKQTIKNG